MGSVRVTVAESKTANKTIELKQRGDYKKLLDSLLLLAAVTYRFFPPVVSPMCVHTGEFSGSVLEDQWRVVVHWDGPDPLFCC